jgi:very-short-patch-repair endonuclease
MSETLLRRLGRDQWVRVHGTPRITVLAGGDDARRLWEHWLGVANIEGEILGGDAGTCMRDAMAKALEAPARPIAVHGASDALTSWRRGRTDRLAAMFDEGFIHVEMRVLSDPLFDARSAAEAALFEALEATPATRGRFELNGKLSVRFGPTAAEIDLMSRTDRIAIEIDGFHHFSDPDCYRRDRRKDLLMQTQGLLVIRVLAEDVLRDPREGVTMVCQALAYRLGERR